MPKISPLSDISPKAIIADDVEIGPLCVVGPDVKLGPGVRLIAHVIITGHTSVGRDTVFHPNSVIGGDPQDKKFRGGTTRVEIGENNCIRENVTIHVGTEMGGGVTRVGNNNLLMVGCHIAHDVQIGSHCILANNATLAGHVVVNDYVNMSGLVGVHHFVTIGEYAYIGGMTRLRHDVPPYVKMDGSDQVRGFNKEGLRRAGFAAEDIQALHVACRRLFSRDKPLAEVMKEFARETGLNPHVVKLLDFLHRRDLGKHGRYLEGLRNSHAAAHQAVAR
jgi:UDP-N-acetylglucosamine acyltransferase